MSNVSSILEKVKNVPIYPQTVIDSVIECDNSSETMHALEDEDLRLEIVEKVGFLIIAVNLAQTLSIEPEEFEDLMKDVVTPSENEHIRKVQSIMFQKLYMLAKGERLSKCVLPSVLESRMRVIHRLIH